MCLSTSYGDEEAADDIADICNDAFARGRQASDIPALVKLVRELTQRGKSVDDLILAGKKAAGMLGECTVSLELCTAIFKLEQAGVPQEDKQ